jgi:hypothetical protein
MAQAVELNVHFSNTISQVDLTFGSTKEVAVTIQNNNQHEPVVIEKAESDSQQKWWLMTTALPLTIPKGSSKDLRLALDTSQLDPSMSGAATTQVMLTFAAVTDPTRLKTEPLRKPLDVGLRLTPQQVSKIQFSNDLTSIRMLFTGDATTAQETQIECAALLSPNSLVKLGSDPHCLLMVPLRKIVTSTGVFHLDACSGNDCLRGAIIQLGTTPTIEPGQLILN